MRSSTGAGDLDLRYARSGRPVRRDDLAIEEVRVRRRAALRPVALDPVAAVGGGVQYWMWNGVARDEDRAAVAGRSMRYELTALADRPLGRERPKTSGHLHVRPGPGRPAYAELCQVLRGRAGFMIQDLRPGPSSTFCVMVVAGAGEYVVLPPGLHHGTISLEGDPLVFADVIDRRGAATYHGLAEARGFAHLVLLDGSTVANPAYQTVPGLDIVSAPDWADVASRDLYGWFRDEPDAFGWVAEPEQFKDVFGGLATRIAPLLASLGEPL